MNSEQWVAFAGDLRERGGSVSLSEEEAEAIASGATALCAVARASVLRAAGRHAAGHTVRRSAWRMAHGRSHMIALTFEGASEDEEFQRLIGSADGARDRGDWSAAERFYASALALYPLHYGYRIQYAHMLKEQDEFVAAEANYRTALALGASEADVTRHLLFVSARQGWTEEPPEIGTFSDDPLRNAPTLVDLEALAYALWRQHTIEDEDAVELLRSCSTCEAAAAAMMADERFVLRNQAFLQLYGARS